MPAEIEVKYLIEHDKISEVKKRLTASCVHQATLLLENHYFDTSDQLLGKAKMGLRIRRWNDQCEQTLKTAGVESGGVSKRPEFNAECSGTRPDLRKFAEYGIQWPSDFSEEQLNEKLQVQFVVIFEREIWHVKHAGTLIEVALDQGKIEAGENSEAISELEFELKEGSEDHLYQFASEFTAGLNLQPGTQSKAQRGYALLASQRSSD